MKPENKALVVLLVAVGVVVGLGGAFVLLSPAGGVLVPNGSYLIQTGPGSYASTMFAYANNQTSAYTVTGAWSATAPVQVIVGELLGSNRAGCGFIPLNFPSGPPIAGCWPAFDASPQGSFNFSFHVCVTPNYLPTGSFVLIFRSNNTAATLTVTQPFVVQASPFPQTSCTAP